MTKRQLLEAIKDLPDNTDVFIGERLTDFTYGLVNNVQVKEIELKEDTDPDSPILARDKAIVLTED